MNYDAWRDVFETHCATFCVVEHLNPHDDKTVAADKKEWECVDALVNMWIFCTITPKPTQSVHEKQNAYDLWDSLENLFS